ncbi:otoferlin, partial [Nephila pilipes]
MIDRKVGEKPIYFEMTLGNAGNMLDGYRTTSRGDDDELDSGSDSGDGSFYCETSCPIQSTTDPLKPTSKDRQYYYLPYGDNKPCVWVRSIWQDHRRRMYNSNVLAKIGDKL